MQKILISGTSNSGKTTLIKLIKEEHNLLVREDDAREVAIAMGITDPKDFNEKLFFNIAQHFILEEANIEENFNPELLLCDADPLLFLACAVMSNFVENYKKFKNMVDKHKYDLYFVCDPVSEYEYDGLRQSQDYSLKLHEYMIKYLDSSLIPYTILTGTPSERLKQFEEKLIKAGYINDHNKTLRR